uniref:Uncharacterized protein n=1 Tax=Anguilla anguilla TaxID=7936 RepID=A0A0E9U2L8_ANGAN
MHQNGPNFQLFSVINFPTHIWHMERTGPVSLTQIKLIPGPSGVLNLV